MGVRGFWRQASHQVAELPHIPPQPPAAIHHPGTHEKGQGGTGTSLGSREEGTPSTHLQLDALLERRQLRQLPLQRGQRLQRRGHVVAARAPDEQRLARLLLQRGAGGAGAAAVRLELGVDGGQDVLQQRGVPGGGPEGRRAAWALPNPSAGRGCWRRAAAPCKVRPSCPS